MSDIAENMELAEGSEFEHIDRWELVPSSPASSSPLGNAVDASSFEQASTATSRLLQDDYFGTEANVWNAEALPLSAAMVENWCKTETHYYSDKLNVVEHAAGETAGITSADKYGSYKSLNLCDDDHGGEVSDEYMIHYSEMVEQDKNPTCQKEEMRTGVGEDCRSLSCEVVMARTCYGMSSSPSASASSSPIRQSASPVLVHMASNDKGESSSMMHSHVALAPAAAAGRQDVDSQGGDGAIDHSPREPISIHSSRGLDGLHCATWILTQFRRWQAQPKCANTIWSVALAAAVMGILFVHRSWQRLLAQNHLLQTELCAKEKKITQLMFQLMQARKTLCATRRVPVIRSKP